MSNNEPFAGQVAVITGGTQGIGEATARLFAERGAAGLIICGRNVERGASVAADISEQGCATHFVQADLANIDDCRRVIADADEAFGAVHCLVNAAGNTDRGSIWDTTPELWDYVMAINARAPYLLMQDALKIMKRESIEGSIVNIISMTSYGGQSYLMPYAAAKGALVTVTRNVAYAVMRHRIRVNGLNIGWTDTPGEDVIQRKYHTDGQDWLEEAEATQPFGRLIKPPEVARAVAFLASAESGLMTGSIVDFDQSVIGGGEAPKPPLDNE